jgi:hypothetical protein
MSAPLHKPAKKRAVYHLIVISETHNFAQLMNLKLTLFLDEFVSVKFAGLPEGVVP